MILWLSSSTHLVSASHTKLFTSSSDHTDSLISSVQERVPIKSQLLPHCALKSLRKTVPAFEKEPKKREKKRGMKGSMQIKDVSSKWFGHINCMHQVLPIHEEVNKGDTDFQQDSQSHWE